MAFLRGQVIAGSSTLSGSQQISGSIIIDKDPQVSSDFFIIRSGSDEVLKANNDGIIQFHVFEDSYTPPIALGGVFFHSSSMFIGLE